MIFTLFLQDYRIPVCAQQLVMIIVFVTGRGGAGFHFVTLPSLQPGVNSMPFFPTRYDTGPHSVLRVIFCDSTNGRLKSKRCLASQF